MWELQDLHKKRLQRKLPHWITGHLSSYTFILLLIPSRLLPLWYGYCSAVTTSIILKAAPSIMFWERMWIHNRLQPWPESVDGRPTIVYRADNIQRGCDTAGGTRHPERERTWWEVEPQQEAENRASRYSSSPAALTLETPACKLLWLTDL